MIEAAQIRAARGLLGWSQQQLADATDGAVAVRSVIRLEMEASKPQAATLSAIRTALEAAGVEFIPENGGGPGVRLRKPAGE